MINVLLTGAGFTANFGSPVASGIYEAIFNRISIVKNETFRQILLEEANLKDSNYEKIYQNILDGIILRSTKKRIYGHHLECFFR